jgi:hypothetical protein
VEFPFDPLVEILKKWMDEYSSKSQITFSPVPLRGALDIVEDGNLAGGKQEGTHWNSPLNYFGRLDLGGQSPLA